LHFLQIWLVPSQRGLAPSYEQKAFSSTDKRARLCLVASPDGRNESLTIHTDALIYAGVFASGEGAELALDPGRHAWAQVARGRVRINGQELLEGDGAALSNESMVRVEGLDDGEVLIFDLA
jgi:redox-sensitive bicupin YhaK (pirin superfamily)